VSADNQAAEREAAGSLWQDTGRVFTTAAGTPLGARHIRKMFQDVCGKSRARQGLGAPGPATDVRLAAVRRWHGDREDRAAYCGRSPPSGPTCWPRSPGWRSARPRAGRALPGAGAGNDGPVSDGRCVRSRLGRCTPWAHCASSATPANNGH